MTNRVTVEDVQKAEIDLLKKRLESMAVLTRHMLPLFPLEAERQEIDKLIDGLSHTKDGKYYE